MTQWNKVAQAVKVLHLVSRTWFKIVICAYLFLCDGLCFSRYSYSVFSSICFHIVLSVRENLLTTNKLHDWLMRAIRSLSRLQESEVKVKVKVDDCLFIKRFTQRVWLLSIFTYNSCTTCSCMQFYDWKLRLIWWKNLCDATNICSFL